MSLYTACFPTMIALIAVRALLSLSGLNGVGGDGTLKLSVDAVNDDVVLDVLSGIPSGYNQVRSRCFRRSSFGAPIVRLSAPSINILGFKLNLQGTWDGRKLHPARICGGGTCPAFYARFDLDKYHQGAKLFETSSSGLKGYQQPGRYDVRWKMQGLG